MATVDESKYTTTFSFRGHTTTLLQIPREKEGGQDNTGWCLWEASNILMRYLSDDERLKELVPGTFSSLRILDLSAGAGLVTLSCAAAGADVVSCDIPLQLPQLERNVSAAGLRVRIEPYWWGEPTDALAADGPFDLVLASDIVFIAIRDGITAKLAATIRDLVLNHCQRLLFVFEERLPDEEQEFMEELGLAPHPTARRRRHESAEEGVHVSGMSEESSAAKLMLDVREVTGDAVVLTQEEALKGAGGHADTDLWNPSLFWEPPPIRLFILSKRNRAS
jgi:predicted nicotinamide N-methyase